MPSQLVFLMTVYGYYGKQKSKIIGFKKVGKRTFPILETKSGQRAYGAAISSDVYKKVFPDNE